MKEYNGSDIFRKITNTKLGDHSITLSEKCMHSKYPRLLGNRYRGDLFCLPDHIHTPAGI